MNLQQLINIVEVNKTHSITWAADNLYMGQPNLSRNIRDLEKSLGFDIFQRTTKGMIPTAEGEKVLALAKKILTYVCAIEEMGQKGSDIHQIFGVSVPRSNYITCAFTRLMSSISFNNQIFVDFLETNNVQALKNVLDKKHNLAIIRFLKQDETVFNKLFKDKELEFEKVAEFYDKIIISENSDLASKIALDITDLVDYVEIISYEKEFESAGYLPQQHISQPDYSGFSTRVKISNRHVQLEILHNNPATYMWNSPLSDEILKKYGLITRSCGSEELRPVYTDMLVYRSSYQLTQLDIKFIDELHNCSALSGLS